MMLRPRPGAAWLGVDEVLRRLRAEFPQVQTQPGGAAEYALHMAVKARKDRRPELADRIEAKKDQGAMVLLSDGTPGPGVVFPLLPEFPLMAGFASEAHLQAIQPLLARCAAALDYDLT
jgi:hypothetical protein